MKKQYFKKIATVAAVIACCMLTAACSEKEDPEVIRSEIKSSKVVGEGIKSEDINEFYYTEENINYDAYFLRYKFYSEDGKHFFFYEERHREDDYGPCTEEDTTGKCEYELTDDEWNEFFDIISEGKVEKRVDNAESGSTGPWLYLYWTGDKSKYQVYSFLNYGRQVKFVEYCESLAKR